MIALAAAAVGVMLVALCRSSRFRIVEAQQFLKAKKTGLTTAVCGSFVVVGLTFLAFTAFLGYIVPQMIVSLENAQCRVESLERGFVEGVAAQGWGGVNQFIGQLEEGSTMANSLSGVAGGVSLNATSLEYAEKTLAEIDSVYLGMQDQYSKASITL